MSERLTCVQIAFYPDYQNDWLRFGVPQAHHHLDRRRSIALFKPGQVFGYVRWRANEYGTQSWHFMIVECAAPSIILSRISGVCPGGDILLRTTGARKVKRALSQIDALEAAGFDATETSPAYYRHVHNRVSVSREVMPYSHSQHAAHLAAKAVAS